MTPVRQQEEPRRFTIYRDRIAGRVGTWMVALHKDHAEALRDMPCVDSVEVVPVSELHAAARAERERIVEAIDAERETRRFDGEFRAEYMGGKAAYIDGLRRALAVIESLPDPQQEEETP